MNCELFVGNLPFSTTEESLKDFFNVYGTVESSKIIKDLPTGRSKGFGFVRMSSESEATAAINGLNDKDYEGRPLRVNFAGEKPERSTSPRPYGARAHSA